MERTDQLCDSSESETVRSIMYTDKRMEGNMTLDEENNTETGVGAEMTSASSFIQGTFCISQVRCANQFLAT